MVVHRRRGCRHRRHHPPLSNVAATAAVVVHDTVLQCIARRHLSPSQWVVDCYLVPLPSPPSTDQWRPNKGGGDCEIKAKN
jgi:hypothetical protein